MGCCEAPENAQHYQQLEYQPPVSPQQPCPKCKGTGYSHDSDMNHDADPNQKCFFCEDCSGCNGRGHIPVVAAPVTVTQPVPSVQVIYTQPPINQQQIVQQQQQQMGAMVTHAMVEAGVAVNMNASGAVSTQTDNVSFSVTTSNTAQPQVQTEVQNANVSVSFSAQPHATEAQNANVSMSVTASGTGITIQQPNVSLQVLGAFTAPYLFRKRNIVVIQHRLGKCLRVNPDSLGHLDPNGGCGGFAQWEAEPLNEGNEIKLKSWTGKYLRIDNHGQIDVGGGGGKWTLFIVHQMAQGTVKLESKESRGKYIAVQRDNVIRVGTGGKWTEMNIYRKTPISMHQPITTVTEVASNEQCPKCAGNGWVHESTMDHQKGDDEKCLFCEDCKGCEGKGYVLGTKKIIASSDVFGHNTVQQVSQVNVCGNCNGHGWRHTSDMEHKTHDPNKRCFFCEDCDSCGGTGR